MVRFSRSYLLVAEKRCVSMKVFHGTSGRTSTARFSRHIACGFGEHAATGFVLVYGLRSQ